MTGAARATVHASAVLVGGRGILITGAPGSGKSSLGLALLEDARGDAVLVGDDRIALDGAGGRLIARAPQALAGLLEVRGVGIVRRPFAPEATVALVVELRPAANCPRLPTDDDRTVQFEGVSLPRLILPAGQPDAALRVRVALAAWPG